MSNHTYPRRLLDDAIDRAVHELVQSDPRPGFRRRVISKVTAPAKRSSWAVRFLVPAAGIAVVLLLAVWLRPQNAPVSVDPSGAIARRPVEARPPAPQITAPAVSAVATPPSVARRTAPRRQQPVPFTFTGPSDRVAATSVPLPESTTPPSGDATLTVIPDARPVLPLIHIAPIVLQPIEVKPLGVKAPQ